jgi:hypothetical protein
MSRKNFRLLRTLTSALVTAGLLAAAQPAQGLSSFLKSWQDLYPGSTTDNADCDLCHGTSTSNLNAYGAALCVAFGGSVPADITDALIAIEGLDSDSDPTASGNLVEIDANAQPGWTEGAINQIYNTVVASGCLPDGSPISVVAGVPLPYDPPDTGMPVAIPGGPYTGNVNVPITFDGSGSYDSDATNDIESYAWNFGDGTTGDGMVAQHTYTVAGTYSVTLTVTDDEGDNNTNWTIATISGNAVLDLDVAAFKVSKSVSLGKSISIQLSVENPGTVLCQAIATVVGTQNGSEVYRWRLNVYDYNGGGPTSFTFPSYKATAKGSISWAVTIADVDPDTDLATAVTTVK